MPSPRPVRRPPPAPPPAPLPRWFRPALLALCALSLLGLFSSPIYDSDFWWHLRTGQYIVEKHALPVPDPFSFTTSMRGAAYPGEEITRRFNLTHEWLAQACYYLVYRAAGFPGIVLFRAGLLALFCGLVGLVAWRRCGGFWRAVAAAFAAAAAAAPVAYDRPYLFTFVFLAATVAILEFRRFLWLLPPLFLVWANCHGGFFLGWIVLAAYSAEALLARRRKQRDPHERTLWLLGAAAILVSGCNPNGFRVVEVLSYYRGSFLTSRLLEWSAPKLWPPGVFSALLAGGAAALLFARGRARRVDFLLFAAFAAAGLSAQRNVFLMGLIAPLAMVSYFPWKRALRPPWEFALAGVAVGGIVLALARGGSFQLRPAEWKYPASAADFLLAHGIGGPIFNTYEYGGYLIWRLWPRERVFIDGRALNESVFLDYARILYNRDGSDGKSAQELLDEYGVRTIVMNGFEYSGGLQYQLAPALAGSAAWKLVYADAQAVVFVRRPPPGVQVLDSRQAFDALDASCALHIEHEPQYPRCARALGQLYGKRGELVRARRWIAVYLEHFHGPDPEARDAYRRLLGMP
ncbi:MAG: hypothetical protein LAQ30_10220 [Acidobacteriia bacterium]|nr:hypothetical protein [Terriglobia bacterium]